MQKGLSESLLGRFEILKLPHWSFTEMSEAFDFDYKKYIFYGGYPGSVKYTSNFDRWSTYIKESVINPNIERDILARLKIEKPTLLHRLFRLGAEYSGQILSYNKMLGHLQDAGNTTALTYYLDLISKVGLITGLSMYTRRVYRRNSSQQN